MAASTNRLRLVPLVLAALGIVCGLWSAAIWASSGFEFALGPLTLRAHRLDRSTMAAFVALTLAWLLDVRLNRRNLPWRWFQWTGRAAAATARRVFGVGRAAVALRPSLSGTTLLLLLAMAAVAGVASVSVWRAAPPFWLDEETIALNIRDRGFTQLTGALWLGQSAPLGWLIVQHAIVGMFGTGELTLRFVPLAFGLATIVAAIWIARRWLGVAAGLVLVVLFGFSQWLEHYRFEVKHYTADGFFALLLPALVVWAVEGASPVRLRRAALWWVTAGVGLWLANGATLVAPSSALLLVTVVWRRDGFAAAARVGAIGSLWLVAFVAHYELSMRATLQSQYLRDFWASPPDAARGFLHGLRELASNPGGTALWIPLWVSAAVGFMFGRRRLLAAAFALVPITAWLLAMFELVPLRDRLALWIAPALYVGVALAVDRLEVVAQASYRAKRWLVFAAAVGMAAAIAVPLCADVVARSRSELAGASWRDQKQGVNDRNVVRWLMKQQRPGDAIATTRQGWPAVWWYGVLPKGDADTQYEITMKNESCRAGELAEAFRGHDRVLLYLGFRDIPEGFDAVIMKRLAETATIVNYRIASDSWAAVVDFRAAGPGRPFQPPRGEPPGNLTNRCFSVGEARLW